MKTVYYLSVKTARAFKTFEEAWNDNKIYCRLYDIEPKPKHIKIIFLYA